MTQTLTSLFSWRMTGNELLNKAWSSVVSGSQRASEHWTIVGLPNEQRNVTPVLDMGADVASPSGDARLQDRLTLSNGLAGGSTVSRTWTVNVKGAEFIEALAGQNVDLRLTTPLNFTTNGSLQSIHIDTGNQIIGYTGAARDSLLFAGLGEDTARLLDHPDIGGDQYWSLIRFEGGQIDAYSLYSGMRIRMEGTGVVRKANETGFGSLTTQNPLMRVVNNSDQLSGRLTDPDNYGSVENIAMTESWHADGAAPKSVIIRPGTMFRNAGDRIGFDNIDLMSDDRGVPDRTLDAFTDSFNLAEFGFIRYTSNNLWAGQSIIYRMDANGKHVFSTSSLTHTTNGTHDMPVVEQATALDGKLRLYVRNTSTELYNEFNRVYLGTAAGESVSKAGVTGTAGADRVALYGFGGNDTLTGGAAKDYLFGGSSTYDTRPSSAASGNQVTGGVGADYFGVGNVHASGNTTLPGTDVILDWDAGTATVGVDSLRVLANGTAVIGGLYGVGAGNFGGADVIDLRAKAAVAISDTDGDGADSLFGGVYFAGVNEDNDVTVVNDGLIVARGQAGNDTIHGSPGVDRLYGNDGLNLINLGGAGGGNDEVRIDDFQMTMKHYVSGFSDQNSATGDKILLNWRILEQFGALPGSLAASNAFGVYTPAYGYDPGLNFMHDEIYGYWLSDNGGGPAYSNATHKDAGGDATLTSYISGAAMIAVGYILNAVLPGLGYALLVPGSFLIASTAIARGVQHENAAYTGPSLDFAINVLTGTGLTRPDSTAATDGASNPDGGIRFFDFFDAEDAGDGYIPLIEFTQHTGPINTFMALYTDEETFIFLVNSDDNFVENAEAILMAEVNGHLTAADFGTYDGLQDIHNYGVVGAKPKATPTIGSVQVQGGQTITQAGSTITQANPAVLSVTGTISDPNPTTPMSRYDGAAVTVYDGARLVGQTTILGGSFTVADADQHASVADQTDKDPAGNRLPVSGDNIFRYADPTMRYHATLTDPVTGIVTRSAVFRVSVETPVSVDGGAGFDVLQVTDKTAYRLTAATNTMVANIEAIDAAGSSAGVSFSLVNQTEGFSISGSGHSDTIAASNASSELYGGYGDDRLTGGTGADRLGGEAGADTLAGGGGADTIDAGGSDADRVAFAAGDGAAAGDATGYDIVTAFSSAARIAIDGFVDRNNNAAHLLFESGEAGDEKALSANTELLVVGASAVPDGSGLASAIAAALDGAFNVSNLVDGAVAFSVKSATTDGFWVGLYNDSGTDDTIQAADITVLGHVTTTGSDVDEGSFWLPAFRAPQAVSFALTADTGFSTTDGITSNPQITVTGLAAGGRLYWSEDGGVNWTTGAANVATFSLSSNTTFAAGQIRVRQVDAQGNYSETSAPHLSTVNSAVIITDTIAPSATISIDDTYLTIGNVGTATFNFSEGVVGVSIGVGEATTSSGDIVLSNLTGSGATRLADYAPAASTASTGHTISLTAGSYSDLAGNVGASATSGQIDVFSVVALSASLVNGKTAVLVDNGTDVSPDATDYGFLNIFENSARTLYLGSGAVEDTYGAILLNRNALDSDGISSSFHDWFAPGSASSVIFGNEGIGNLAVDTYIIITGFGGTVVYDVDSADAVVTPDQYILGNKVADTEAPAIYRLPYDITSSDIVWV
ncbi:beta strand repeat-containing protein [Falsiroseomonas sp.]|uniref:beta strand repeat-containing protein n=1 Tax=Falsiroseomonas sp. TaxID=2870721 RepID=UPI003F72D3AE